MCLSVSLPAHSANYTMKHSRRFNYGNQTMGGNYTTQPSIQFISKTNSSDAYNDFKQKRQNNLKSMPSTIDPSSIDCSVAATVLTTSLKHH